MVLDKIKSLVRKEKDLSLMESHACSEDNISSILDFLEIIKFDFKEIETSLKKLKELEKESHILKDGLLQVNLEAQNKQLKLILSHYGSISNDVAINGIRLKQITKEHFINLKKNGMKDFLKEKKNNPVWKCLW
jgi:hypothetical protein